MPTKKKPKTNRQYFRANFEQGDVDSVEADEGIVRGMKVISQGIARGHGLEIDEQTLDQVVALGNKIRGGLKSRFGHPGLFGEGGLGTFLGRVKKLRRDGESVRGDLHFDATAFNTPKGDLAGYILQLAESDPLAFGASVVFEPEIEETEDDALDLVRVKQLFAVDVVDDPAANVGLFSVPGYGVESMPKKTSKKTSSGEEAKEPREEDAGVESKTDFEEPVDVKKAMDERIQVALRVERMRISKITKAASSLGIGDEDREKAISEGVSVEDAYETFIDLAAKKRQDRLEDLTNPEDDPGKDLGAGSDDGESFSASPSVDTDRLEKAIQSGKVSTDKETLKSFWDASKKLRGEWQGHFETFEAYTRNCVAV